jgi:hypothetical protein
MSRTRLAVWAAGAALLAAWLSSAAGTTPAVVPTPPPDGGPAPPQTSPPPVERIDLDREVARMTVYLEQAPRPRPVVRNPFILAPRGSAAAASVPEPAVPAGWAPAAAAQAVPLPVSLAGIATDETPSGPRRTAILSIEGQVVLAQVGDELRGPYQVQRIDEDAVELFDAGRQVSFRLTLP